MKTAVIHARIEPQIKQKAEGILQNLGITPTEAIRQRCKETELYVRTEDNLKAILKYYCNPMILTTASVGHFSSLSPSAFR